MLITIELNSPEPIYLQIYAKIVSSIAKGILKANDSLPSSRKLAKDLGINYHTVNKAYQLLGMEGFVSLEKKRISISSVSNEGKDEFIPKFEAIGREIINEGRAKGFDDGSLLIMFQNLLKKEAS